MTFIQRPCEFTSLHKKVENSYKILKHTKYGNSLFLKHRIYIMT